MAHANNHEDPAAADRKADVRAVMVIFTALVLAAVHFISGWTIGV